MTISYSLSTSDIILDTLTLSGASFGLQHRKLSESEPNMCKWLGHSVLFVSECLPIIGILVAAVEYAVTRVFFQPCLTKELDVNTFHSIEELLPATEYRVEDL